MAPRKVAEQILPAVLLMKWQDLVRIAVAGAVAGLLVMALYVIFDRYVFSPTLCSDLNIGSGRCENKLRFSSGVALILGALPLLFFLVHQRVYRPLLVILLSVVALWELPILIGSLPPVIAIILAAVIFGLTNTLFAWIVQLRNFVIALGASIIVLVLIKTIVLV